MKKIYFFLFFLTAGLLLSACGAVDSANCANLAASGPKIKINGAWSRAAEGTSAAYLVINNCGTEPDALLKVTSDVAEITEVHVTETRSGVTTMTEVQKLEIPAGKKVELKEGGYHVMLMKLKQNINPGDQVEIIMTFEKAGEINVIAPARSP